MERIWAMVPELGGTQQRDIMLLHLLSHGLQAGEVVSLTVGTFDVRLLFLADMKTNEPRLVSL